MKHCPHCGIDKPLDQFGRDNAPNRINKGSVTRWCKQCKREYAREYRIKNKKRLELHARQYMLEYNRRPEVQERNRQWFRDAYHNDPEFRAKHRARYHKNKAKRQSAPGHFSAEQWREMLRLVDNHCCKCHKSSQRLHADHILPIAQNGCNCIHNIQPLCKMCNGRKQHYDFADYRPLIVHKWLSTIPHNHAPDAS